MPSSTACAGSFGVVRILPTLICPDDSSMSTRSVNVPPISTPSRADMARSVLLWSDDAVTGGPELEHEQRVELLAMIANAALMLREQTFDRLGTEKSLL